MKKVFLASLPLVFSLAFVLQAGELKLGQPLTATNALSLTELTAKPDAYVGKPCR